jgi:peroxiredoxin
MRALGLGLALVLGFTVSAIKADDLKVGGPFQVKAITGENKDKTLCYYCKYSGEARPAVVMIFTQKADDNFVAVVKAVDEVQKNDAKLGTVVVGISGVTAADFEKVQTTHKLTTPLTIAEDKDGPSKYNLSKDSAVTVLVYQKGNKLSKSFTFKDTKSASEKAGEIAEAAKNALK